MKRRTYITNKKVSFANRRQKANNDLIGFKEKSLKAWEQRGKSPDVAEMGFELYESLLEADYGLKDKKPKLIGELFGIKIKVDPMLKKDDVRFEFD